MAVDLDAPLPVSPGADEKALLARLQGNILRGHGRRATAHVFLRFDPEHAPEAHGERIALLESEVAELRRELETLRQQFAAFQKQFQ